MQNRATDLRKRFTSQKKSMKEIGKNKSQRDLNLFFLARQKGGMMERENTCSVSPQAPSVAGRRDARCRAPWDEDGCGAWLPLED